MKSKLASNLIGLWLSAVYIYVFSALVAGHKVVEPDFTTAMVELVLSAIVTVWFVIQVSRLINHMKRGTVTMEGWTYLFTYGDDLEVFGQGIQRRIVNKDTGKVITEYETDERHFIGKRNG